MDDGRTLIGFLAVCCAQKQLQDEGAEIEEVSVYGLTSPMMVPLETDERSRADTVEKER